MPDWEKMISGFSFVGNFQLITRDVPFVGGGPFSYNVHSIWCICFTDETTTKILSIAFIGIIFEILIEGLATH